MPRKLSVDWSAARTVYVNDATSTYRGIAERFGCAENTVRVRACREKWPSSRVQRAELLLTRATQNSVHHAAEELGRYNEADLAMAKALRAAAARQLQPANVDRLSCADIRALASAVESAQRIGRLALGATASNSIVGAIPISHDENFNLEQFTDEELLAFRQLLNKAIRGVKSPGDDTIQ